MPLSSFSPNIMCFGWMLLLDRLRICQLLCIHARFVELRSWFGSPISIWPVSFHNLASESVPSSYIYLPLFLWGCWNWWHQTLYSTSGWHWQNVTVVILSQDSGFVYILKSFGPRTDRALWYTPQYIPIFWFASGLQDTIGTNGKQFLLLLDLMVSAVAIRYGRLYQKQPRDRVEHGAHILFPLHSLPLNSIPR